ncbi:hypothetical protein Q3G72_028813 [Acer saccharum]|nr:hypothetical protein Q3G72_028813 [Acer saccharum]
MASLHVLMLVALAMCLDSVAYASEGTATFYTPPYVPASYAIWNNGAVCNKSYRIKCTGATNQGIPQPCKGGTVVVKIVDLCPSGCQGTIDLSKEAFSMIANPDAGKIKIEYNPYVKLPYLS